MVDALESLAQTKGLNYASSTTRQSNCGTPQRDAIMRRRGPCTCCAVKVAHRRAQSPSPYCIPRPHSAHVSYIRRIALSPTRRLHLLNMLPEDGKSQQPLGFGLAPHRRPLYSTGPVEPHSITLLLRRGTQRASRFVDSTFVTESTKKDHTADKHGNTQVVP